MNEKSDVKFNEELAIKRLMHFLSVEGLPGQEGAMANEVIRTLEEAGVPREWISFDDAHKRIPLPSQIGNLIVRVPGTIPGPTKLLSAHLDTVPLAAGCEPVLEGGRIVPKGATALGGDDRTGVACLVTILTTLLEKGIHHSPLTFLFTVREEVGTWGARTVEPSDLGFPVEGYNIDGGSPGEIVTGAVGAERWEVEIRGKAAHAGVHPERGISATLVASIALSEVFEKGWFGKVSKDGVEGTSNIGTFGGENSRAAGDATNVVTDYVLLKGESRSHNPIWMNQITDAYRNAFETAASRVQADDGSIAEISFRTQLAYEPFRLEADLSCVQAALRAAKQAGYDSAECKVVNGGLDANWFFQHGIPAITFGAGQHNIHTVNEYIDVAEFLGGCRMGLALVMTF